MYGARKQEAPNWTESTSRDPSVGDPGLTCLIVIAHFHGIAADAEQLRHQSGLGELTGRFSENDLLLAAKSLGLKTRSMQLKAERLEKTPLPALLLDRDHRHFIVARVSEDGNALIQEGDATGPRIITQSEVISRSDGRALLFTSRASLAGDLMRFDFSWFIPALVKYRRFLLEVLLISAVLQLLGLVSPLMFQVVMDKVLVNQAFSTLNVVCVALLISSVAETLLTGLRNYVLTHTTSRMDVELGARLFRHLLALPLGYFEARRVGDTVTRVRELENIRNFLTGQTLTSLIDLAFSLLFVAVMCLYSVWLTLVVVASLPVYAATSAFLNPAFRQRLNQKFARSADNQSLLVETVSGIETIKSMAVEPQFTRRWDQQLAAYVTAGFRVTTLGNVGQQLVQLTGKLVTVVTLFLGAKLVISGKLSVGELIAFNMMAQRVSGPVLRLAQLWQDFQQVGIAMQRLGDILNTRNELPLSRQALPEIDGAIEFSDIHFRYKPDAPLVLKAVTFSITPGQVVGIVGRSGSGKSTLTKLLQRLYLPEQGRITIDGHDLALCDPAWLRRQVGVVLQENLLFNRSIRDNIALTDPGAPLEQVIHVARLAGIHDVISRLPEGYDTRVGENGTGLSGGQKQRIAIARALLGNPRILVFDEATGALDYETERIIQNNMQLIGKGRTVIIVAHRLSAVRHADRILAMDDGQVVEMGRHDELVASRGYYATLVSLQNQGM
ncbi:MAG: type I secretion system permease/ATPase [Pseudomonadota bacterium]|nr:type I secretion system permease/ATPase [Pseudomonadota bacterium]